MAIYKIDMDDPAIRSIINRFISGTGFRYMSGLHRAFRNTLIDEIDAFIQHILDKDGLSAALFEANLKVIEVNNTFPGLVGNPQPVAYYEFKAHPEIYS